MRRKANKNLADADPINVVITRIRDNRPKSEQHSCLLFILEVAEWFLSIELIRGAPWTVRHAYVTNR